MTRRVILDVHLINPATSFIPAVRRTEPERIRELSAEKSINVNVKLLRFCAFFHDPRAFWREL